MSYRLRFQSENGKGGGGRDPTPDLPLIAAKNDNILFKCQLNVTEKKCTTDADIPVSQYPPMQAYKGDLFFQ